jgi:hypothetical protein
MGQGDLLSALTGMSSGVDSLKQFTENQAKELEIKYIEAQTAMYTASPSTEYILECSSLYAKNAETPAFAGVSVLL